MNSIDNIIQNIYNNVYRNLFEVYEIFENFYGEERVDLQMLDYECFHESICVNLVSRFVDSDTLNKLKENFNINENITIIDCIKNESTEVIDFIADNLFENKILEIVGIITNGYTNNILVHFPVVTVTNEFDRSTVIKDLYVKVPVRKDGCLGSYFTMNRSTYTQSEYYSDYMHSHICGIPKGNHASFQSPCLGRGPIRNTITSLLCSFDATLWNLFCYELSVYVKVESIEGVPYRRIENIGNPDAMKISNTFIAANSLNSDNIIIQPHIKNFIAYYAINNNLKFCYVNNNIVIGNSFKDFIVDISNAFIKWCNNYVHEDGSILTYNELINGRVIYKAIIVGNIIYKPNNNSRNNVNYSSVVGTKVCVFKGVDKRLNIIEDIIDDNRIEAHLLNNTLSLFVLNRILKTLNYFYGKQNNGEGDNTFSKEVRIV